MNRRAAFLLGCLLALPACEKLESFDTEGTAAYCGSIVDAQFVSSINTGFDHESRMRLTIDTSLLTTTPGHITTDDSACGEDGPTFVDAPIRVSPEIKHDPLSLMTFEDGQVHNIVGWVSTPCRGSLLVIASLYKGDRVSVRLLESRDKARDGEDAFSLFTLTRNEAGCGF